MSKADKLMITKVHLINYKRMARTGITNFLYTPDDTVTLQLLLGGNGSGKSSLFYMFWFLPGSKHDFGVNGSQEIEGVWNGKTYNLFCTFGETPHYQFSVDGVELNSDGKIGMCLTLCKEHLHVTPEVRALALDKDPLTSMSPMRRRYWMLKLADTDYTYAMGAYAKLKSAHSDATGMANRLKKRQLTEIARLADASVVKELTADTHAIKKLIDEMYSKRNANAPLSQDVKQSLVEINQCIDGYIQDVDGLDLTVINNAGYKDLADLEENRESLKLQINSTQTLSQQHYQDHEKLRKKYDMLVKAGTESIGQLSKKIAMAEAAIQGETSYLALTNVKQESDPQQMKDAYDIVYIDLFERVSSLQSNDGLYCTKEAQEHESKLQDLRVQLRKLHARTARLMDEVEHRRGHIQKDSISCPNCKHSWTTIASEDDLKRADAQIVEMKQAIHDMELTIASSEKYLAEYSTYSEAYRVVMSIMRSAPILNHYFNEITQNNRLVKYPGSVAADMHLVTSDLEHLIVIAQHKKIIKEAEVQIELKKNLDADTLENIEEELGKIEELLNDRNDQLTQLNAKLHFIETLIRHERMASKFKTMLLDSHQRSKSIAKLYAYARYQELIWVLIKSLQVQLARKEDALAYINGQQQIVDEIASQLEEAHMNERVAKAAHIALSPVSGAIAEGLQRFVNLFVGKLNRIIAAIWAYPLEIQPFEMVGTGGELDYKFPFVVDKKYDQPPNKDVIEGSMSMLEIFNYAFKVATLQQMGLGHLPLFLDEFEGRFDTLHRERAIYFVQRLIDEGTYGQIFMISHYETNHGALNSVAQTCIISRENLLLTNNPRDNEHVVMS